MYGEEWEGKARESRECKGEEWERKARESRKWREVSGGERLAFVSSNAFQGEGGLDTNGKEGPDERKSM